jgi:hypothetical protein
MVLLFERAGRLTALFGGFWPGQVTAIARGFPSEEYWRYRHGGKPMLPLRRMGHLVCRRPRTPLTTHTKFTDNIPLSFNKVS